MSVANVSNCTTVDCFMLYLCGKDNRLINAANGANGC